jgi:hypothetical protein
VREELREKKQIEVDKFGQIEKPEPVVEFRTEPKKKAQGYKPTGKFAKS